MIAWYHVKAGCAQIAFLLALGVSGAAMVSGHVVGAFLGGCVSTLSGLILVDYYTSEEEEPSGAEGS